MKNVFIYSYNIVFINLKVPICVYESLFFNCNYFGSKIIVNKFTIINYN